MSAADTLRRLRAEGFDLQADGHRLMVGPASKLTDDIRAELKFFRVELLVLLAIERQEHPSDPRVRCVTCAHYSPTAHRCRNYRAALLMSQDVAPALAVQRQHCPGHRPRLEGEAEGGPETGPPGIGGLPDATRPRKTAPRGCNRAGRAPGTAAPGSRVSPKGEVSTGSTAS